MSGFSLIHYPLITVKFYLWHYSFRFNMGMEAIIRPEKRIPCHDYLSPSGPVLTPSRDSSNVSQFSFLFPYAYSLETQTGI